MPTYSLNTSKSIDELRQSSCTSSSGARCALLSWPRIRDPLGSAWKRVQAPVGDLWLLLAELARQGDLKNHRSNSVEAHGK